MYPKLAGNYFESDEAFDNLYPINIKALSAQHWTPLNVIKTAALFLAPDHEARVMDIGAGVGKFCIAGSYYAPGNFTGIEQRGNFVRAGNKAIKELGATRALLIHGNFMQQDMQQYS